MFNDTYYTNKYIAEVGGVTLANINDLERYFVEMVDYNLNVTTEEFNFYEQGLSELQIQESNQSQAPILQSPSVHSV